MTHEEAERIGAKIASAGAWRYDDGMIDEDILGGLIAAALLEAAGQWNADVVEKCARTAETMAWSHPNTKFLGPEQNCLRVAEAIRALKTAPPETDAKA